MSSRPAKTAPTGAEAPLDRAEAPVDRAEAPVDRAEAPADESPAARLARDALTAIDRGARAVAVDRLIDAEAVVAADQSDAAGREAIAGGYRNLRMYELALPHLEHLPAGRRWQIADLHLDWADELDQIAGAAADPTPDPGQLQGGVGPGIDTADDHRRSALQELAGEPTIGPATRLVRALTDEGRLGTDPAAVDRVPEQPDHDLPQAVRTRGLVARTRALLALGRISEAIARGQAAVELAAGIPDSAGIGRAAIGSAAIRSATLALHGAQLAAGRPGAVVADRLISGTALRLWQARWNAVINARMRRDTALLTERRDRARQLADRDPLTSVANRDGLARWLADHSVGPVTLVLADLQAFKSVNDRFGHTVGDRTLVIVARAMTEALPGLLVSRVGGDEFVVVDDRAGEHAEDTMRAIREALSHPDIQDLLGEPLLGCDFGWSVRPPGADLAGMLDEADRILRTAKRARRR